MKTILQSLRMLLALTVLTGQPVGSALLAQKTESPAYFWPRPSAADFATVANGASNHGPTSDVLKKLITEAPQLGFLGEPRVNVLALNLALDAQR